MDINDLKKSISEMSDDELRAVIGQSRNNRRQQKEKKPPTVKVKETRINLSEKKTPAADFSKMTPAEAIALLKKLGLGA